MMRKVILMCATAYVAVLPVFAQSEPAVDAVETTSAIKTLTGKEKKKNLSAGKMIHAMSDEDFNESLDQATPDQVDSLMKEVDEINEKKESRKRKASRTEQIDINLENLFENHSSSITPKPLIKSDDLIKIDADFGVMYDDETGQEVRGVEYEEKEVNWEEKPSPKAAKKQKKEEKKLQKKRKAEAKKANYAMSKEEQEDYLKKATDEQLDAFFDEAEKNGDQVDRKKTERKRKKEAQESKDVSLATVFADDSLSEKSKDILRVKDQQLLAYDTTPETSSDESYSLSSSLSSQSSGLSSSGSFNEEVDFLLRNMQEIVGNLNEVNKKRRAQESLRQERVANAVQVLINEAAGNSSRSLDLNPVSD